MEKNGRKEDKPAGIPTLTIRGDRFLIENQPHFSIKLDPTCTPKLLDVTLVGKNAARLGTTLERIYRFDGDMLVWCWNEKDGVRELPMSFETASGTGLRASGLSRVNR